MLEPTPLGHEGGEEADRTGAETLGFETFDPATTSIADAVAEQIRPEGADVVFECVGSEETIGAGGKAEGGRRPSAAPAGWTSRPRGSRARRSRVAKGTAHEAYLRTFFRDSSIRAFESHELARDALISGAVDLLFDDGIGLVFWLNGTASKACCEFKGGPFGEPKYFGDGVAWPSTARTSSSRLLINAALKRLRENGRYEELLLRYFPLRAF